MRLTNIVLVSCDRWLKRWDFSWVVLALSGCLLLPTAASAQTVVGSINVGITGMLVQITDGEDNNLTDTITLQATNNTGSTYSCKGHIGFFDLTTGDISGFPVDSTATIPPGGPYIIVSATNPLGSGVGNTNAYDSASCTPINAGSGGGGNSGTGTVELIGQFGESISFSANTVTLTADEVENTGTTTTGTLRLELWALSAPYSGSGGVTGVKMGAANLPNSCGASGTIAARTSCSGIQVSSALTKPNPGTYYLTLFLTEDLVSCNGFCIVDYGNFGSTFTISAQTNAAPGGGIELVGTTTILPDFNADTVKLTVPEVLNSTQGTTGTLRLELWLTTSAYAGQSISGNRVATTGMPTGCATQLVAGGSCLNISGTLPMTNLPAPGSYFATLVVTQFDSVNCTAADHYCIATAVNYNNRVTVPAPAAASPPPSSSGGTTGGGGGGGGGAFDRTSVLLLMLLAAAQGFRIVSRPRGL